MSSDFAIKVEKLSKCYHIYNQPRDRLKQFLLPRLQRLAGQAPNCYFREFWALKDVSFTLGRGETVGIIGRNGSGKSTLLQLICGTLNPSAGSINTNGRIAALLELGSGFNPEFTGRENVYMNASVLGLKKEEIDACYDDIADFADIGDFIEQPVKTYSSGMMVRLAFSVIAHVDADILVVDEALSVGDALFAQKCMRFIRSFQERGTLLFVSHDMGAVQNLCKSSIWIDGGKVEQVGNSKNVTQAYLRYTLQEIYGDSTKLTPTAIALPTRSNLQDDEEAIVGSLALDYGSRYELKSNIELGAGWQTGAAEIIAIRFEKAGGGDSSSFEGGEKVRVLIRARAHVDMESPILGFLLKDRLGQDLFGENTLPFTASSPCPVGKGDEFEAEFIFRLPMLPNGEYAIMASVADGDLYNNVQHHYLHDAVIVNVMSSKVRWGLLGLPFEIVTLRTCGNEIR